MFGVVSAGLMATYYYIENKKEKSKPQYVGTPDLGGPFTLVDHFGRPKTDLDFKGKYMFIYFGFTFCPDICPTELRKMALVMEDLRKLGYDKEVQPLFISVDPWRDTVEQIRGYITEFHPAFLGLTGTPEQVMKAAKAYRVYSSRPPNQVPTEEESDDYLVDHTIFMYLVGPDGKFLDYYGQQKTADEITQSLAKHIRTNKARY